jgi:hypothetical protein
MSPLLRRIFSRKTFVRLAFVAALLFTLLIAFIAFENRQGERAWAAYRADAEKRGVAYRREAFLPPSVPDAENFAAIPLFQEIFAASSAKQPLPQSLQWNPNVPASETPLLPNRLKGERMDFARWQKALSADHRLEQPTENAARDVLTGLASFEPELQQLRDAARRPHCKFPIKWEEGLMAVLPHLGTLQAASRLFAARMTAHLALGDSPAALADWRDGLALYRALEHEPVLISGLVRISILSQMEAAIWTGLVDRKWGDPELRALIAELATLDLLADSRFALGSERCGMNGVIDDFMEMSTRERVRLLDLAQASDQQGSWSGVFGQLFYPRGWFRESQVKMNEFFDRRLARIDPAQGGYVGATVSDEQLMRIGQGGFLDRSRYLLAALLMPALNTVENKFVTAHTINQQARTACALELFRRTHGTFPERLEELSPDLLDKLPHDIMDGAPMRYRRTTEGGFELWSIGLDRKDDGGKSDPHKGIGDQTDWLWRS